MACARLFRRLLHRALLHHRAARRDADHDARPEHKAMPDDLLNEMAQHALRDVVVGDHALLERTDRDDIARRAADHAARLLADREHLVRILVDRDHGRLAQHDSFILHIDQHIRRAEIDSDIHRHAKHFRDSPSSILAPRGSNSFISRTQGASCFPSSDMQSTAHRTY